MAAVVTQGAETIDEIYLPNVDWCWKNYFDPSEVFPGGTLLTDISVPLPGVAW